MRVKMQIAFRVKTDAAILGAGISTWIRAGVFTQGRKDRKDGIRRKGAWHSFD